MRLALVILLLLASTPLLALAPTASADATCHGEQTLCVGEATQECGGPAPYGDGWEGFTGAWGETHGVEYGVGGWDRCHADWWSAGAFVNVDEWPLGRYQTVAARFDYAPYPTRDCYVVAGFWGWRAQTVWYGCPRQDLPWPQPAWGALLP